MGMGSPSVDSGKCEQADFRSYYERMKDLATCQDNGSETKLSWFLEQVF